MNIEFLEIAEKELDEAKEYYDYEHIAGCIRVVLKIRREYFHVALMTASLLSSILKTSRTQPMFIDYLWFVNSHEEYYDTQHSGLGDQFIIEIISVLERIKQHPNAWHPLGKRTRRCQVKRFPYAVIYQTRAQDILVVAIMNLHREPNYWKQRVKT